MSHLDVQVKIPGLSTLKVVNSTLVSLSVKWSRDTDKRQTHCYAYDTADVTQTSQQCHCDDTKTDRDSAMHTLPSLPGFFYDKDKGRYFPRDGLKNPSRIAPPDVTAEKNKFNSSSSSRNTGHKFPRTVVHHVYSRETSGLARYTPAKISSTLLCSEQKRKRVLERKRIPPKISIDESLILIREDVVEHRCYPSGSVCERALIGYGVVDAYDFWKNSLLIQTHAGKTARGEYLTSPNFSSHSILEGRDTMFATEYAPTCCVGLDRGGTRSFVAGYKGFTTCQQIGRPPDTNCRHPDRSEALCTTLRGKEFLTGTRGGNAYLFDRRLNAESRAPVTKTEFGKGHSVCALQWSQRNERVLYVSAMSSQRRDNDSYLHAWDLRQMRKPLTLYNGHRNEYKRLSFDIEETSSGGLLASGGDDGLVRFWSIEEGGRPLCHINFGNEVAYRIKMVGWNPLSPSTSAGPGAWIVTDSNIYVVHGSTPDE